MSGKERVVSCLASHMAAWRGHGAIAPLGHQIDLLKAEMLGRGLLDIIHRHALFAAAAQMGPQNGLGLVQAHGADPLGQTRHEGVERAFQFPNGIGEAIG